MAQQHEAAPPPLWLASGYLSWLALDSSHEFGTTIKAFTFPLLALATTGDSRVAGVVGAAGTLSLALADLIGGNLADRWSKLILLRWASAGGLLIGFAWWALQALHAPFGAGLLLSVTVLYSVRHGIVASASTSVLVGFLDERLIGKALATNQGRDATISLAGPPIGGILMGFGSGAVSVALVVLDGISWVSSLGLTRRTGSAQPIDDRVPNSEGAVPGFLSSSVAGFRWIFGRPDVLGGLGSAVLLSIGLGLAMTTQVFSLKEAGHSTSTIGLVSSGLGLGMLLGSLVSGQLMNRFRGGALVLVCNILMVLSLAGLTVLPLKLSAIIPLTALFSLGIPVFNAVMMGYVLLAVPHGLMGRVNSAATLVTLTASSVPPLLVGFLLPVWGRELLTAASVAVTAAAFLMVASSPALRGIPRSAGWKEYAAIMDSGKVPSGE